MIETVTKRSGEDEPFDVAKIEKSVREAANDADISDAESAVRAVVDAVNENAGDRTVVAATEIRDWALATLDTVHPEIADAWRAYDSAQGK